MQAQITYRGLPSSNALNDLVQEKVAKVKAFSDRVRGCQVVIERPHRHHHKGWLYRVRVRLSVEGRELIAEREVPQHSNHDAFIAVRSAFHAALRQLKAVAQRKPEVRGRRNMDSHHELQAAAASAEIALAGGS